jgi:hypothetical protein
LSPSGYNFYLSLFKQVVCVNYHEIDLRR